MGPNEQQDYVELIAWIVKQDWCNGRVGGIGQSYYAMAQWLMATMNPPGLACIVPYDGLVDQYRGSNYHGGIFCSYRSVWYTSLRADNQHRLAGRHGRAADEIRSRRRDYRTHRSTTNSGASARPTGGSTEIKVPVLSIGHWGKMGLHLRGNILGYEEVQGAEEACGHGRAQHVRSAPDVRPGRFPRKRDVCRSTTFTSRASNNGFMESAPVKIFVRGANVWRAQKEWPPQRASIRRTICAKGRRAASPHSTTAASAEQPAADEAATSYSYPDWEWVNGVVVIGPTAAPTRRGAC